MRCKALDNAGFKKHCFTTREGGVSTGYLAKTNLSFSREDRQTVEQNYRIIANTVGFSGVFALTNQEHTDTVKMIDSGENEFITSDGAVDGYITNKSGVCLVVFVADCVPVIIADIKKRAVACVHSGWRGTAKQITRNAIEMMACEYGTDPSDLICAIGPCIGKCCYEVGQDVYDEFSKTADATLVFDKKENGKYMLDLVTANRLVLKEAGVPSDNIYASNECTFCKSDLYYSHRATKGKRGNMAAMIEI